MKYVFGILLLGTMLTACAQTSAEPNTTGNSKEQMVSATPLDSLQTAYFASGCFWCVEAIFESVKGVEEAVSGYSGGEEENPTYAEVSTGSTGHAEAVKVYYDSSIVSFETLVDVFFNSHDPTTLNQQGPDRGPQYRSVAFYQTPEEKEIINRKIQTLLTEKIFGNITTEVTEFEKFYEAEAYHQNYERLHPDQPYVRSVSIPRLNKFREKMPKILK